MKIWAAPISFIWGTASLTARALTAWGLLPSERLQAGRVISVGNLQAGGAGKTPLVAQIAREAVERGLTVCILSRGYKSSWEQSGGLIEPGTDVVDPSLCGDEPALLHERAPGAWIAVGADRVAAYKKAVDRKGGPFELVILDDGLQHWKIQRDLDVVAVTSARWWSKPFREFAVTLPTGALVVWTKGEAAPALQGQEWLRVRYKLAPGNGRPVWLVSGVADSAAVQKSVEEAGWRVIGRVAREDHATYRRESLDALMESARIVGAHLATTGKDWVKWQALGIEREQVVVFEPELEFDVKGATRWRQTLWGS